ncbi:hypothetical protein CCMSSC00406_0003006 [Pleurotus cornucopiae]|uniref:Uncharacterized protein n=1 Tax=Pleurotus cornucopiae TaxID=5321 RepID=A0ACB7J4J4_PLECO|nr:hypothetical protein CCMSSC00406_0003006 [Pleurotus cornucopiae]
MQPNSSFPSSSPLVPNSPAVRGRIPSKRGRKPKAATAGAGSTPLRGSRDSTPVAGFASPQFPSVQWPMASGSNTVHGSQPPILQLSPPSQQQVTPQGASFSPVASSGQSQSQIAGLSNPVSDQRTTSSPTNMSSNPIHMPGMISFDPEPSRASPAPSMVMRGTPVLSLAPPGVGGRIDEEVEGEDELLPAMADDDYSAQLSWQSQSKDNLKVLMDNFSPAQYERFEAYRRHALPKQAVIQQSLGQQVSQPVAQIVAGFAKVFVGEIVEKARAVQSRRGDVGPLSPDHLREAYRMYQMETGRVGAARPLRSKKLFVK